MDTFDSGACAPKPVAMTASAPSEVVGARQVSASRGQLNGRVNSEWASRPADEKFTSLEDLRDFVAKAAQESASSLCDLTKVRVITPLHGGGANAVTLALPDGQEVKPTNWSFGQACALTRAPASYLRSLPATLAGINLQHGLNKVRAEVGKAYVRSRGNDLSELRALTSASYGRILDLQLVEAVQRIAGNGIGETHWKVPGVLDWETMTYNPFAPVTSESTTLFASDRDVFLFLVDDTRPIEIGKLPNGDPDLLFRGFYAWNSEVGAASIGVATMYMRAVCQNRNLWGVEGFREFTFKHSSNAPARFVSEVQPALESFALGSPDKVIAAVSKAKGAMVTNSDEGRERFLSDAKFTAAQSKRIIDVAVTEEGYPPSTVWDFVQAITAFARGIPNTDERIALERRAAALFKKA